MWADHPGDLTTLRRPQGKSKELGGGDIESVPRSKAPAGGDYWAEVREGGV